MMRTFALALLSIAALANASSLRGGNDEKRRELLPAALDSVCNEVPADTWLGMASLMGFNETAAMEMYEACVSLTLGDAGNADRDDGVWVHNCHGKTAVLSWKAWNMHDNPAALECDVGTCGATDCFFDKDGFSCDKTKYNGKPQCGAPKAGANPNIGGRP